MTAELVRTQRPRAAPDRAAPNGRRRRRAGQVLSQVLLTLVLAVFLTPFAYMIATALKPPAEVFASGAPLVGSEVRWSNFVQAWTYLPFDRFILNGLVVSIVGARSWSARRRCSRRTPSRG